MEMNNLEQIFTPSHQGPEKNNSASGKDFSSAPEEQLKFPSILYWFIDFPECGKYFIK